MKIYKTELRIQDNQRLELPAGYVILKAGEQNGALMIWYMFDENELDVEQVDILVVGTGHKFISTNTFFIGTVLMSNGLVWHVFEKI